MIGKRCVAARVAEPDTRPVPMATASIARLTTFCPLYVIGRCGQDLLQLSRGHQASGESQAAENDFD